MGATRGRDAGLRKRRGGLLLTPSSTIEDWLDRGVNRDEWDQLETAASLAEGFVFLSVQTGDREAERYLGELLAALAAREGRELVDIELGEGSTVAGLLERMLSAARPAMFWLHRAPDGAALEQLFSLLNQKREVVSRLADGPLILALHRQDWQRFRRHAPDFWSVHQTVSRFSPGREPAPLQPLSMRGSLRERSLDAAPPVREKAARTRSAAVKKSAGAPAPSGWRVAADDAPIEQAGPAFFGRQSELSFLVSSLSSPGARVLLCGPPGAGKTALLHVTIPRVADHYSDGVFRISFQAPSGDADERLRSILTRLISELAPSIAPPPDLALAELGRSFQAATSSLEALFVFDDVDDLSHVGALIPGPRASVLVATHLAAPADSPLDQVLELGGLGIEAGAALLQSRAELDDETARQVATSSGSRPSVLNLLGAILADEREAAPAIIERLRREPALTADDDMSGIDERIDHVLARCSPEAQALWPRLGLFRGDLDQADAAALVELEQPIKPLLIELADVGLIEPAGVAERCRFFPLLRGTAVRRLEHGGHTSAAYLAYAQRILLGRDTLEDGPDVRHALDWIRAQRDEQGQLPEPLLTLALDAGRRWLAASSFNPVVPLAFDLAMVEGRNPLAIELGRWLAASALSTRDTDAARAWFQRLEQLGEDVDDVDVRAEAHAGLATVAAANDEPERALELVHEALELRGDRRDATNANILEAMAALAHDSKRYDDARRLYREALAIQETLANHAEMFSLYERLGTVELDDGERTESARAWADRALALELEPDPAAAARLNRLLGDIARCEGQLNEAERRYEQARLDAARAGDDRSVFINQILLGQVAWQRGDLELATSRYADLAKHSVDVGSPHAAASKVIEIHAQADDGLKPRIRRTWEQAGLPWPEPEDGST